jgi:hypothetical protein
MARTTAGIPTEPETDLIPSARMEAVWAKIAESTKDLSDEERAELGERLVDEIKTRVGRRRERDEPAGPDQGGDSGPIDLVAIARERQDVRAKLLEERLERAVDTLVRCKLPGQAHDRAAVRAILFELYEKEILTKADVRRRGQLGPEEFYEELRAYRLRSAGS